MFKISIIVIVSIIGLYNLILNIFEYFSANNPTPKSVEDVYDAETYQKWKKYSAEHCTLNIIMSILSTVVSIVVLATEAYALFASLFPENWFGQLAGVVILELIIGNITGIIKSYISNMVIEQKYGFNKSTKKTFILDCIRTLIIEIILSFALVLLLASMHMWLGNWMILLFAAALFLFTLFISFMYPVFSKIGNKFVPLDEGELRDKLSALLEKHGYTVKSIDVMDASRRTTKLNAYFTGFGKMKQIVLYDNLVNSMSPDEVCAVFSHELGHGLHKDVLKNQVLNIINMLILALVAWFALSQPLFYTEMGFIDINYGFTYILIGIFSSLYQPFMGIFINFNSRRAEYRADKQAVKEGYGNAMITALKKLAKDNFAHLAPSKIHVVLEYSHPPLASRIEEIEKQISDNPNNI